MDDSYLKVRTLGADVVLDTPGGDIHMTPARAHMLARLLDAKAAEVVAEAAPPVPAKPRRAKPTEAL